MPQAVTIRRLATAFKSVKGMQAQGLGRGLPAQAAVRPRLASAEQQFGDLAGGMISNALENVSEVELR